LGTHVFGGDPYWTGVMGRAYVEGVRAGAENRLAVVARSFPGKGSSDRSVDVEVPTVRRSLEQLKQIELARSLP
jgi:beta-N-acetylhexosaminidase